MPNLIAYSKKKSGLSVQNQLDKKDSLQGNKVINEEFAAINMIRMISMETETNKFDLKTIYNLYSSLCYRSLAADLFLRSGAFKEEESRVFQVAGHFGNKTCGVNSVRNPVVKG